MSCHTADHLLNTFQTVNGTANTSSSAKHLATRQVKLFKEFGPQMSYQEREPGNIASDLTLDLRSINQSIKPDKQKKPKTNK